MVSVLPTALLSCALFQDGGCAGSSSVSPLAQCVMGCKAGLEEEGKASPTPLQAVCVCTELDVGIREQPPQGKVGKGAVIFKSMLYVSLSIDSLGFLQTYTLYLPLIPELSL